jgi:hypothetical protein
VVGFSESGCLIIRGTMNVGTTGEEGGRGRVKSR